MASNTYTDIKKGVESFGHGLITFFAGERGEKLATTIDGLVDRIPTGDDGDTDTSSVDATPEQLEGKLAQATGAPEVYLIQGGKKHWIPSEAMMHQRFGSTLVKGRWTGVVYVTPTSLSRIAKGEQLEPIAPPIPSPQKAAAAASLGLSGTGSQAPSAEASVRAALGLDPAKA